MTVLRLAAGAALLGAAGLALAAAAAAVLAAGPFARTAAAETLPRSAHDFSFTSIDGAPMPLSAHAGKVMLVVNTASRCGFTPQYEGLQALWDARRDQAFVLIGAPSDAFNQELSTAAEVKEFCETVFSIDFPMTDLVEVRGAGAHPFFAWATEQAGAPTWNFNKYLIDGSGRVLRRYGSMTSPDAIGRDIDALLQAG